MPYIPPPPRPPAPPRPPPVFRPPAQNLHFQQQQRFQQQQQQQRFQQQQQQQQRFQQQQQQQQRFQQQQQQQQRFQQQQQFQHQMRHQENIRRVHQNIQMDNQRRQQLHQQQLQRQQQQQQFQRQQEEFRRQQQEQLRRQQQDNFRRQEQQRQQDLLRNFQRSTAIGGNTVVHVSPGFTLQVSGVSQEAAEVSNGAGGIDATANGAHLRTEGVFVASEATGNGVPQSLPPQAYVQQAPPTAAAGTPVGQPPPYPGAPLTTPPPPLQPIQLPQAQAPPSKAPPTESARHLDNRVILKDGTQIILHQEDEILFIGPTGIQMVVNCLPLYDPLDEEARARAAHEDVDGRGKRAASQSGGRSKLIKARSMESIASSQMGDEDTESKTVGGVATPPRRKGSQFIHYSVTVHDKPKSSSAQPTASSGSAQPAEGVVAHGNGDAVSESDSDNVKVTNESESSVTVKVEPAEENSASVEDREKLGESDEVRQKTSKKKEGEQREHTRLHKARSVRTSLSPDGEGSDSEDNSFSVEYVQDPFIVPQLKRSSGSVSFYHPPSPGSATSPRAIAASKTRSTSARGETLLERSCENKLDDDPTEKREEDGATVSNGTDEGHGGVSEQTDKEETSGEVVETEREGASGEGEETEKEGASGKGEETEREGASGEGELTSREKSLSTAKPPLVEETATILQQSASVSPTAPNESSPPSLSTSVPPPSPGATAQAPPPSNDLALPATPLPATPITLDNDYTERSGWMNKLSHRKGMFGDKWQKRYFVLHRSWLYYFKKYGDSNPRGVIRLLPTGWCKLVPQGTRRMSDAVINRSEQTSAVVSVLRCLAVHRPNNFAASLSALLGTEGIAEAFRSQTVSVSNAQHSSRTFYMIAASNEERDSWIASINNNIKAYAYSGEALDTSCKELKKMLRAVQSNVAQKDIPAILLLLTAKMKTVIEQQQGNYSSSHSS